MDHAHNCHLTNSMLCSYGHFAMVKALIDAGAKADICDKFGKTPLDKSTDIKSPDGERTTELIQSAVARERSDPNYIDAATRMAIEIRLQIGSIADSLLTCNTRSNSRS